MILYKILCIFIEMFPSFTWGGTSAAFSHQMLCCHGTDLAGAGTQSSPCQAPLSLSAPGFCCEFRVRKILQSHLSQQPGWWVAPFGCDEEFPHFKGCCGLDKWLSTFGMLRAPLHCSGDPVRSTGWCMDPWNPFPRLWGEKLKLLEIYLNFYFFCKPCHF